MTLPPDTRGILLDIEGTTTPIAFVHDTLFPFARQRLDAYCLRAATDPAVGAAVERLRGEQQAEPESAGAPAFGSGAPYAAWLMDQDRKSTGLKELQGIIWEEGYQSGELTAPVFEDVQAVLEAWRQSGLQLRIFSSGSVLAQKLLFGHTDHGDLTGLFEGYHDTTTGPKQEAESYRLIAAEFELPPGEILFLSDVCDDIGA